MKIDIKSLPLSPALRAQLSQTVAARVAQSGSSGADSVSCAPSSSQDAVLAAELTALQGSLLSALGKKSLDELQGVSLADCSRATSDPIDALVLHSLVMAIAVHCRPVAPAAACGPKPPRCEALPKLSVVASAGSFESPQAPRRNVDPLLLVFDHVAPSTPENPTQLYLINKSNLDDRTPLLLPGDLSKAVDGKYSLILGDEWMAQHGIRPSQTLAFYQTKGDGKRFAPSEQTTVSVNAKGPGLVPTPALPPGDRIGEVAVRELFRRFMDIVPAPVRPKNLRCGFEHGMARLSAKEGAPGTEPFARVMLQNLATKERGPTTIVGEDDAFTTGVAAKAGDPILVRIFDHSRQVDDPQYERRLTFIAGEEGSPLLATNPMLGIEAPPALHMGRIQLGGQACDDLSGKAAVTPGSIVSLARIGLDGKANEAMTTIADEEGSFSLAMAEGAHAGDVYALTVQSPFCLGPNRTEVQVKAQAVARFELQSSGALALVDSKGAVAEAGSKLGDAPVVPLDNVDRLSSGEPIFHPLQPTLLGLDLRFEPFNPNTGNGASIRLRSDGRAAPRAQVQWDDQAKELVVRLAPTVAGGWPEADAEHQVSLGFGAYGATNWAFQNGGVGPVRNALVGRQEGETIPVRFELEDRGVFARGQMLVNIKTEGTGSGLGGTQQTRYVRLVADTLQAEGG